jgi:hypothetical protein
MVAEAVVVAPQDIQVTAEQAVPGVIVHIRHLTEQTEAVAEQAAPPVAKASKAVVVAVAEQE